jgi:hypothetical protein
MHVVGYIGADRPKDSWLCELRFFGPDHRVIHVLAAQTWQMVLFGYMMDVEVTPL